MYNCQLCGVCVGPSIVLQVYRIHRQRLDGHSEIAQEIPVCMPCHYLLQQSIPVESVREMHVATRRRARVTRDNVNPSMTKPLYNVGAARMPSKSVGTSTRPARPTTKHASPSLYSEKHAVPTPRSSLKSPQV